MKKALMVATVFKFLNFERSDLSILKEMGYELHSATNMQEADWLKDDGSLDYLNLIKHQIDFGRSPFSSNSVLAYKQLKALLDKEKFDVIHCHTPVASAIVRLAARKARKNGTKIIYTCHGFHFHKKSSKIDWLVYYPIERFMARFTDMIITINKEDYHVIQKFKVKEKRYIPGVGIDVNHIANLTADKRLIRERFNIPQDAFVILSVGEISARKNHEVVIRAISMSSKTNIYYLICGDGSLRNQLECLAKELKISDRIVFAGQQDHETVLRLCHVVDVGALPSLIEGLGLAGVETLAAGTPMIASDVHGIKDYVVDGETGICCQPDRPEQFCTAIERMIDDQILYNRCKRNALKMASRFDIKNVKQLMIRNYRDIGL